MTLADLARGAPGTPPEDSAHPLPSAAPNAASSSSPPGPLKRSMAPAAGAVVGTSLMVLLVELARTGALQEYKDLLAPLIGWGPGLLILLSFIWLANQYMPPFLESQRSTALALQKLAHTVAQTANTQHDVVLAVQVNSDKLEQLRGSFGEMEGQLNRLIGRMHQQEERNGRTQ